MLKVLCLTIIVGVTLQATRSDDAVNESQCTEEIERELQEYVKSEVWQQLFTRHYKYIINGNGEFLSERKRLKFNTIIHNALYGCNHERDDEADDCPNIRRGIIKSCKLGKNLRAAMFRTARCSFVESSVKHLVLSDALLDTFPIEKLDSVADAADKPIRAFGRTVADMLAALGHGETGGLGELMALNLYLNNVHGTVLMHRVPVEPVTTAADLGVAAGRARAVHAAILGRLRTFWDTWCGDRDVVAQYRAKYRGLGHAGASDAIAANADEAGGLVAGLGVTAASAAADLDPARVTLARYTGRLVSGAFSAPELVAGLALGRFEVTYEFDPRAVRAYLRDTVFRTVRACFYWTVVAHLRLAARYVDQMEDYELRWDRNAAFAAEFVRFARPLAAFAADRQLASSPRASENLARLLSFVATLRRALVAAGPARADGVLLAARPAVRRFADALIADMADDAATPPPPDYFADVSYDTAVELMRSNHRAFARLVSAASGCKEDRANVMKLDRFFFFSSEAVAFGGHR